jgi:hypothetical protein
VCQFYSSRTYIRVLIRTHVFRNVIDFLFRFSGITFAVKNIFMCIVA